MKDLEWVLFDKDGKEIDWISPFIKIDEGSETITVFIDLHSYDYSRVEMEKEGMTYLVREWKHWSERE